ncbi:LADA_0F15434g1_1 [Lachancea dasiensis]|uniref:Pre-rRNA-processing protein ESF2 n=1 Tax=Lachancea dasiensis TaxID=1072105 RepID=A0A1G4JNM7_9SACH|nr:LADA_0F15434g1_1 [Lachancea dasiensis]
MDFQDSGSEDYLSDEETSQVLITSKKNQGKDVFNQNEEEESEVESEIEDHPGSTTELARFDGNEPETDTRAQISRDEHGLEGTEDEVRQYQDEEEKATASADEKEDQDLEGLKKERLERLKKLRAVKKSKHKTGVVYLSKIPPYMKPAKMRQLLSRFGDVDRLFLKREDDQKHRNRVRGGGNKKVMFEEGWVEFVRKKDAKLCADTLNGNIIGGKKGNFYHDDVMNVKYLSGFKWADLTEQIARENDVRQAKLQLEVSQANKMNAEFIRNVERSKMLGNIKASKKRSGSEPDENIRQEPSPQGFKQRRVTTTRAAGPEEHKQSSSKRLDNVIQNLF